MLTMTVNWLPSLKFSNCGKSLRDYPTKLSTEKSKWLA